MIHRWKVLSGIVRAHGWARGAELGVWKGQTLFHLLDTCPSLSMIGVDYWPTSEPHEKDMDQGRSTWYPPEVIQGHRAKVLERAKGYEGRLVIYEMDTVAAADKVEDASLDFIFVDADHSTEGVLRDVGAWRQKVRTGGAILGHDEQWGSVQRALKQLFPSWSRHGDNVWSVAQ